MAYFGHLAEDGGAGTNKPTLLALRFLIAAACLWGIVQARGLSIPRGTTLKWLVAMGAGCYFAEAAFYFHGLDHAGSGTIAMLLYTYPAMVAIVSWTALGHTPTRRGVLALVLAITGTTLTVIGGDGLTASLLGIALGLGCAAAYAIYILASAKIPDTVHPLMSSTIVVTGAAVSFTLYALAMGPRFPHTPVGWVGVASLALLCTVLAISVILAGLARIGPVRASTIATIEPLATVAVGAALLGERVGVPQIIGGVLIVAGAVLAARSKDPARSPGLSATIASDAK